MRGYHFEPRSDEVDENGELTLKGKIREEMIQKLASEWNEYHSKLERRSWRSDEERDEEAEYLADQAQDYASDKVAKLISSGQASFSEDDLFEFYKRNSKLPKNIRMEIGKLERKFMDEFYSTIKSKQNEDVARIQVIEELLSELGARMMRPYEHWNEEEHIREYMERDRDYE